MFADNIVVVSNTAKDSRDMFADEGSSASGTPGPRPHSCNLLDDGKPERGSTLYVVVLSKLVTVRIVVTRILCVKSG
jgi:hypothetical protein